MAKMKMDIDTKRFRKWIRETEKGLPAELKDCLLRHTVACADMAKQFAPVDTGHLRNSITYEMQNGGTVGKVYTNGVEYAKFLEFGTVYIQPAIPFMRPAYEVAKEAFVDECNKILDDYLNGHRG